MVVWCKDETAESKSHHLRLTLIRMSGMLSEEEDGIYVLIQAQDKLHRMSNPSECVFSV
jgi:hypothetical protein